MLPVFASSNTSPSLLSILAIRISPWTCVMFTSFLAVAVRLEFKRFEEVTDVPACTRRGLSLVPMPPFSLVTVMAGAEIRLDASAFTMLPSAVILIFPLSGAMEIQACTMLRFPLSDASVMFPSMAVRFIFDSAPIAPCFTSTDVPVTSRLSVISLAPSSVLTAPLAETEMEPTPFLT